MKMVELLPLKVCSPLYSVTELQIRSGNWDDLGIIIHISVLKHLVAHH